MRACCRMSIYNRVGPMRLFFFDWATVRRNNLLQAKKHFLSFVKTASTHSINKTIGEILDQVQKHEHLTNAWMHEPEGCLGSVRLKRDDRVIFQQSLLMVGRFFHLHLSRRITPRTFISLCRWVLGEIRSAMAPDVELPVAFLLSRNREPLFVLPKIFSNFLTEQC